MKKLNVLFLSIILIIMLSSIAEAKNGPHTGPDFAPDTDACAGCHRTHSGTTSPLLGHEASSMYEFCTYCHNGTGANTNVVTGVFEGNLNIEYVDEAGNNHNSIGDGEAQMGLNGGGFNGAYLYDGRRSRNSNYSNAYSGAEGDNHRHNVVGDDITSFTAWGGGDKGPGEEINGFTCVSCHDPHGTENTDGSERYRILKGGVGMSIDSTVNGKMTGHIKSNERDVWGRPDYTRDAYQAGITNFCTACHSQYMQPKGTVKGGTTGTYKGSDINDPAGIGPEDDVIRHRHKMTYVGGLGDLPGVRGRGKSVWDNMNSHTTRLPLEQDSYNQNLGTDDTIACLTCHQSHGTAANMSAKAAGASPANSSTLLRLPNRGVCVACHYK